LLEVYLLEKKESGTGVNVLQFLHGIFGERSAEFEEKKHLSFSIAYF